MAQWEFVFSFVYLKNNVSVLFGENQKDFLPFDD